MNLYSGICVIILCFDPSNARFVIDFDVRYRNVCCIPEVYISCAGFSTPGLEFEFDMPIKFKRGAA
jgi:hypothetical protein